MSRRKKLIRNIIILSLICSFFYFTGGYYLSREACIMDSIRSLYCEEDEFITSSNLNDYDITLVADLDNKTASLFSTKRVGFLYRIGDNTTGNKLRKDKPLVLGGLSSSQFGSAIYIYRNDKNIEKIEVAVENGETVILDEWEKDFILLSFENKENWTHIVCRVYDDSGNLIYETAY